MLSAVFPNPFEPQASVALTLDEAQRVAVLHDGPLAAGEQTFTLEAADLPSVTYLVRATGDGFSTTQRAVLVK